MVAADPSAELAQIRSLAAPLTGIWDLDPLLERVGEARLVGVGDASHGTREYYQWRALLTRRLVEERGFTWIGVEGDWPDCWRIDRWVRGQEHQDLDAAQLLAGFGRWPTWMWANQEVAEFLTWLREWNRRQPPERQVGFYGLDVYSLWDSLARIIGWLGVHAPQGLPAARSAWQCFLPYHQDPQRYAVSTRLVPESCEADVVALLAEVRRRAHPGAGTDDDLLDVLQNAETAARAEEYYRVMVRGSYESWNLRDFHMADTVDRLARHHGPGSRGLVWEHNSHIGDARATDMGLAGMLNVGQLLRQRYGQDEVVLVGTASHRGTVVAADAWGSAERINVMPVAQERSHEDLLHEALGADALLVLPEARTGPWLQAWRGHRAVGVVYDPRREERNYVPTRMGGRYDALLWLEQTHALRPLHREPRPRERELETEPTGF